MSIALKVERLAKTFPLKKPLFGPAPMVEVVQAPPPTPASAAAPAEVAAAEVPATDAPAGGG